MKVLVIAAICGALLSGVLCTSDCHERAAKISINMTDCCNFPDMFSDKVMADIKDKLIAAAVAFPNTPLFDCLIEQNLYFSNNLADNKTGTINKDACIKYIAGSVKEKDWIKVITAAFKKCSTEAIKYAEKYQEMTGIDKKTCDFKYDAISDCIDMASFSKCPDNFWTKEESKKAPCDFLKSFLNDCYKDISAIEEFMDHQAD